MRDIQGRTAVVTGGAGGIGLAIARLLRRHGTNVFVGDIRCSDESMQLLADEEISFASCDVRREADVQQLVDQAAAQTGRLDIMVNNAGVGMVKQITEVSEEDWDACIDVNLKGVFFGCKHAIKHMQRSGGGSIVNIASNAGLLPRAHDPVYSISKQAVVGLTKSLALCHGKDRIRVNAVCPGPVRDTAMMNRDLDAAPDRAAAERQFIAASPLARAFGRMIDPDEVAAAVLYLVSDAAVLVTGTAIAIDGGKSLGVPPP